MTTLAQKNLYAELHLQPTASPSEIRTAYRRAALLAHPDKGGSTAAFHTIALAFEVLSCPASRALYDQSRCRLLKASRQSWRSAFARKQQKKVPSPAAPPNGAPSRLKRKRAPSPAEPGVKRCRTVSDSLRADGFENAQPDGVSEEDGDHPAHEYECNHDTRTTLEYVRATLQEMTPPQRRAEIAQMPAHVRNELLTHMTSWPVSPPCEVPDTKKTAQKRHSGCPSWSRGTDVRTLTHIHKTSYQAQLRIRHLRLYTRAHADIETVISFQMALIRIRHAIEAAGEEIWSDPTCFCRVFAEALECAGISQEEIGLSVFIFMRAEEWIGRFATITSPVMPLADAVAVHSRLLAARASSWAEVRTEWVLLMRQTQYAHLHQLSQAHAEAIADNVRLALLQQRLKGAVKAAERAVRLCHRFKEKQLKVRAQLQRRAAKEKAAVVAVMKHASRKQQELRAARRRWFCRADLTMEEILQGPPQHLRWA